jgi:hypothetical protein
VNFCTVYILQGRFQSAHGIWRNQPVGYEVIGRQINVVAAKTTFEYLNATINRMASEFARQHDTNNMSKMANSFKKGLSDRLQTRLWRRYFELKEASKAEKAAASSTNTANALVLALEDVETKERDLNRDFENGLAPGTSERERLEREMRWAAEKAARSENRAVVVAEDREPETEKQKAARLERERKAEERERARREKRFARDQSKVNWAAYAAGESAADKVSLDQQIDRTRPAPANARRIT